MSPPQTKRPLGGVSGWREQPLPSSYQARGTGGPAYRRAPRCRATPPIFVQESLGAWRNPDGGGPPRARLCIAPAPEWDHSHGAATVCGLALLEEKSRLVLCEPI